MTVKNNTNSKTCNTLYSTCTNIVIPKKHLKLRQFLMTSALLVATLFNTSAHATRPIRNHLKLWDAKTEKVIRVSKAQVILADYPLIRKDFPEVQAYSNSEIDSWLIRNTAFISKPQAQQTVVNDLIPTSSEERKAYRPREYRRAHVFKVDTGGLIDAKGTGSIDPSQGNHENGLATLGDMIREYAYEKLIHAIFLKDGRFDTVGSYAVIDYGFNIKHADGGHSRAGTVLRQAHVRDHSQKIGSNRNQRIQSVMLPHTLQKEIELFLRKFGITSSLTDKPNEVELVNLQGSEAGDVIDFGSFIVKKEFKMPVFYFYDKKGNADITDWVTHPAHSSFVQPKKGLQLPFEIWGYSQTNIEDSKYDNPYIWSHELAEAIAEGRANRSDAEKHLQNLFDNEQVQNVFKNIQPSCKKLFKK